MKGQQDKTNAKRTGGLHCAETKEKVLRMRQILQNFHLSVPTNSHQGIMLCFPSNPTNHNMNLKLQSKCIADLNIKMRSNGHLSEQKSNIIIAQGNYFKSRIIIGVTSTRMSHSAFSITTRIPGSSVLYTSTSTLQYQSQNTNQNHKKKKR